MGEVPAGAGTRGGRRGLGVSSRQRRTAALSGAFLCLTEIRGCAERAASVPLASWLREARQPELAPRPGKRGAPDRAGHAGGGEKRESLTSPSITTGDPKTDSVI